MAQREGTRDRDGRRTGEAAGTVWWEIHGLRVAIAGQGGLLPLGSFLDILVLPPLDICVWLVPSWRDSGGRHVTGGRHAPACAMFYAGPGDVLDAAARADFCHSGIHVCIFSTTDGPRRDNGGAAVARRQRVRVPVFGGGRGGPVGVGGQGGVPRGGGGQGR